MKELVEVIEETVETILGAVVNCAVVLFFISMLAAPFLFNK